MQEYLDAIRSEFIEELDKRKELLDKITELQNEIERFNHTLAVIRKSYPMRNCICKSCAWADECINESNVEGKKQICSSFVAE